MMHNPPHPGEVLSDLYLDPLGLTIAKASRALGVSRTTLSHLAHGRGRVTPTMAVRLAKAFRNSPEGWMNLQQQFDLYRAQRKLKGARIGVLKAS